MKVLSQIISACQLHEQKALKPSKGAVTIYDWDRGGRDIGGGLEKIQYPKRDFEKFLILERGSEIFVPFKVPKIPGEGLTLDQILSYCTSIQILMRSPQLANMTRYQLQDDLNSIF